VLTIDKGHEGGGGNGDKDESEVNYWLKRKWQRGGGEVGKHHKDPRP